MLNGRSILVTGGTGTYGRAFFRHVLSRYDPRRLICFSRDEFKQWQMREWIEREFPGRECVRWFIGDVRDHQRLRMAFRPADIVIHAAALKHVPSGEVNPIEVIKTNVMGAQNVILGAIECGVERVLAISTDKACQPINLYGASKLCAEKLLVAANALSGENGTVFSVVRYGNVVGSRGSVIPLFLERAESGVLPVTHAEMTRFLLRIEQGVEFSVESLGRMRGGEIYVPKIPSARIVDLAKAVNPDARIDITGIRAGEKLHESLISPLEARNTVECGDHYVIEPEADWYERTMVCGSAPSEAQPAGAGCDGVSEYRSDTNEHWLSHGQLQALVAEVAADLAPRDH